MNLWSARMVERIKSRLSFPLAEVNYYPENGISNCVVLRNRQKYLFFSDQRSESAKRTYG